MNPTRMLVRASALGLVITALWATRGGPASAQATPPAEPAAPASAGEPEDDAAAPDVGDTIANKAPPALRNPALQVEGHAEFIKKLERYSGREQPAIVYYGAEILKMDPQFVVDGRSGLEKLYLRDYKGAKAHFDGMTARWPGTALAPVGQVLVWQAMMLENFDFKYEAQYQNSYKRARQELEEAMLQPGNEGWENFIFAGILGIDAIHVMRHEDYMTALNRGYEAMKYVKKSKELAPDFPDTMLGDGLFNYWVSVISMSSKAIPDIGDRRQQGIQQMMKVESEGVFLGPPATLGLTFTWIEENKRKEALVSALRNHRAYPDNVINNLVLSRVYMSNRNFAESEKVLRGVLTVAPENQRAHYYLGRLYLRWNKIAQAQASFDRYLAFQDVSDYDRAVTLYYVGTIHSRQKDYAKAEEYYRQAWKLGKIKRARYRLDSMKEQGKK